MTERKVMKKIVAAAISLALIGATPALAQDMAISQNGSRAAVQGPAANFTGSVLVEPFYDAKTNIGSTGAHVAFAPGARSDWHTHPAGQVLIVTDGVGWVQQEGGAKREIKPGDVIWTPPGVKHWHGATATNAMRHIAISGTLNGKNVDWMEKVTDEQYGAK
jgi:quercetin dioxygenase-like cupin family protein